MSALWALFPTFIRSRSQTFLAKTTIEEKNSGLIDPLLLKNVKSKKLINTKKEISETNAWYIW